MSDQHMSDGLVMTWVPVREADGRVRMEARWTVGAASAPLSAQRPHAA